MLLTTAEMEAPNSVQGDNSWDMDSGVSYEGDTSLLPFLARAMIQLGPCHDPDQDLVGAQL